MRVSRRNRSWGRIWGAAALLCSTEACVAPRAQRNAGLAGAFPAERGVVTAASPRALATEGRPHLRDGALSISAAVQIALAHSPKVRAVLAEVGIPEAELWRASHRLLADTPALANSLRAQSTDRSAVTSGFGIIVALRPALRAKVLDDDAPSVEQRVADATMQVTMATQRAYVDVQHAQQRFALSPSMSDMVAATRAALGHLLGGMPSDTTWTIADRLGDPDQVPLALTTLQAIARTRRPDLVATRYRARAALRVAPWSRLLADPMLITSLQSEAPDVGRLSVMHPAPLPTILDSDGAALRAIDCVLAYENTLIDAKEEIRGALEKYRTAQRKTLTLRTSSAPAYLDALREYWNARADLERATGGALSSL